MRTVAVCNGIELVEYLKKFREKSGPGVTAGALNSQVWANQAGAASFEHFMQHCPHAIQVATVGPNDVLYTPPAAL
eukprot:142184-Prorocentrum_lima.AAC.1